MNVYRVSHNFMAPGKKLCSKMALEEVGVSLSMVGVIFFFKMQNPIVSEILQVKVESLKF